MKKQIIVCRMYSESIMNYVVVVVKNLASYIALRHAGIASYSSVISYNAAIINYNVHVSGASS